MIIKISRCAALLAFPLARAEVPAELAAAMQYLREQHSYSWEVINGDPGPVEQSIETAHGTVKTLQHNNAPHLKGRIAASGEMLIERDWPDGLKMQTLMTPDGAMVTETPEGWLSRQAILEAITEERMRPDGVSSRIAWLPAAESVDTRRPDQELIPIVNPQREFEVSGDIFTCTIHIQTGNPSVAREGDLQPTMDATISIHVTGGVLRDYEIKSEVTRYLPRSMIPVVLNSDRIVILTYLPVGKINVPAEARAKLISRRSR